MHSLVLSLLLLLNHLNYFVNSAIEQFLIKELKSGRVIIMDNAAFHKSNKTRELIESVGCRLIFLPPYSPDLNPIKKFWANMKRWIKNKIFSVTQLHQTITDFFSLC
jgi:transposase